MISCILVTHYFLLPVFLCVATVIPYHMRNLVDPVIDE